MLTRVIANFNGTPTAVVVEIPKLVRMSLRTIPLATNTLATLPCALFVPSAG